MDHPRVLIITLDRTNESDTANNGLLLRNIFGSWPRESLAQIYSSKGNGDSGFFSDYYKLGSYERRLGKFFYKLKSHSQESDKKIDDKSEATDKSKPIGSYLKSIVKAVLVDSGLYEIIFKPKVSDELAKWIYKFKPDIIFCQGYNLTFAYLPLLISKQFNLPVAYYPTDDWPNDNYRAQNYSTSPIGKFVSRRVSSVTAALVDASTVRLAFNKYMRCEYERRYRTNFSILMHGDDVERFKSSKAIRLRNTDEVSIVCTGIFNRNRKPLLDDLEIACALLAANGLIVKASVLHVNPISEILTDERNYQYLSFMPAPAHDLLACYLKGADILFLPERFDESSAGIALSVSSKAHLFMFSEKPVLVYSDLVTGIARYASDEEWALVLGIRSPELLAGYLERLIQDKQLCKKLIESSRRTASSNHSIAKIQTTFSTLMSQASGESGNIHQKY